MATQVPLPPPATGAEAPVAQVSQPTTHDISAFATMDIKNTIINTGPDVILTQEQKILVATILDVRVALQISPPLYFHDKL